MVEYSTCKITHLPTGRYFLAHTKDAAKARDVWRTKLRNCDRLLPHTVRKILDGLPAKPEEWSFEVLGTASYQTFGPARDAFDTLLRQHVATAGWENILNVDVFMVDEQGRRVRTPESAHRRREATGAAAWDRF